MASLVPQYRKVQRGDGGFDFYNGNQKTTIENYTQGTGQNGQQLRQQLAQAGDPQSRAIIARPQSPQQNQAPNRSLGAFFASIPKSAQQFTQGVGGVYKSAIDTGANTLGYLGDMGAAAYGGVTGNQDLVRQSQQQAQQKFFNTAPGQIAKDLTTIGTAAGSALAGNQLLKQGVRPSAVISAINQQGAPVDLNTNNSNAQNGLNIGIAAADLAGTITGAGKAFKAAPTVTDATKGAVEAVENINPQVKQLGDTITQYQKAYDVETNPARRAQINQGIADLNTQRRKALQGGFVQLPGKEADNVAPIANDVTPQIPVEPPLQKTSAFTAKTVPASQNVTDPLKAIVAQKKTLYDGTSNEQHLAQSVNNLQQAGSVENLANDVTKRLDTQTGHINSQDVADSLTAAQGLDLKGGEQGLQQAADIYNRLAEHLTASGQTSQAASLILRQSPEGLQLGAYRQLRKAGIDVNNHPEIKSQISSAAQKIKSLPEGSQARADAVQELVKSVGENIPPSLFKNLTGVWKAGLLSGTKTTLGNILSNATFGAAKTLSDIPAVAADKLISLATKERTVALTPKGLASGGITGIKNGAYTLKTGIDRRNIIDTADKFEQHQGIKFKNPVIQKIAGNPANTVFNFLGAQDQPFYFATLKNSLADQALAASKTAKLSGQAKRDFIQNFVDNPPSKAVETATREANKSVLSYDTVGYAAVRGLQKGIQNLPENVFPKSVKNAASAVVDVVVPFARVPSAFISRVVDFTPLGPLKEVGLQIAKGTFDQRQLAKAFGEGVTGTSVIALGALLAGQGKISGDYPSNDPKEAQRWKAQGITPNSVKVGNTWVNLNYLGPVGLLFNAGSQVQNAVKTGGTAVDAASQAIAGLGQGLMGQSFLQGFSGLSDAINDPERNATSFIKSQAASIVPNVSADVANVFDSMQRQTNNVGESILNKIPGARNTLAPKVDVYGNDLAQPSGVGANTAFNPLKPSNQINSQTLDEVARLAKTGKDNEVTPVPTKTIGQGDTLIKLTPEQQTQRQKNFGETLRPIWSNIINSDAYKAMDDTDKAAALKSAASDVSSVVNYQIAQQIDPSKSPKALTGRALNIAQGTVAADPYLKSSTGGSSISITPSLASSQKDVLSKYSSMNADDRDQAFQKDNGAEYAYDAAKYANDKAAGKVSAIQDITAKKTLKKEKVGANYPKDIRDLYELSKSDLAEYIAQAPNPQEIKTRVAAYDRALYDAGVTSTVKYKPNTVGSIASTSTKKKSTGSKKTSSNATLGKALVAANKATSSLKAPTTSTGQSKPTTISSKPKASTLKKYAVQSAKVSGSSKIKVGKA